MYHCFIILIVIFIILKLIVKIKYRFWSIQPVFHYYNIFYWLYPPGIIHKDLPKINKYVNLVNIKSAKTEEYSDVEKDKIIYFIKQYYLRNKYAEYNPNINSIMDYLLCSSHSGYICIYKEPSILTSNKGLIKDEQYSGVITARPLYVTLYKKKEMPVYYVDNLCVHKAYRKKGIAPKLIQTLYYNLRHNNKNITTFLFKREGRQNAFVPLVRYKTYGYKLSLLPTAGLFNNEYTLIEINSVNFIAFRELLMRKKKKYDCVVLLDLACAINLLEKKNIFIYGLLHKNQLITAYIFRDAKVKYSNSSQPDGGKNVDIENTIEAICSLGKDYASEDIFYIGFREALERCKTNVNIENVLIEETGNNHNIIDKMKHYNTSYFIKSPTSFFFYNYGCYSISERNCLLFY